MNEKTTPLSFGKQPSCLQKLMPEVKKMSVETGTQSLVGTSKFAAEVTLAHAEDIKEDMTTLWSVDALEPGKSLGAHASTKGAEIKRAYNRTSERLAHAVKRMKQKGLHKKCVYEISKLCLDDKNPRTASAIGLLGCILGGPESKGALWAHEGYDDISDETYEKAIELVMFLTENETMYSQNMYAALLNKHIDEIYVAAVLIHCATYQKKLLEEQRQELKKLDDMSEKYGGYDEALDLVTTDIDEIREAHRLELEEQTAKIQKEADRKVKAAEDKIKEIQKQAKPAENKLNAANKRITEQTAEIAELQKEVARLNAALEHKNEHITNMIAMMPSGEDDLPELPDNILVIGGHPNIISRFKQKYPNWRYIKGTDKGCTNITQPACVFLLPVDLTHSVQQRVQSMISPDTPVIKITSTNIDRMERDMQKAYGNIIPVETED